MSVTFSMRQVELRQRTIVPSYGRATVLAFVMASGATIVLPTASQAQDLTWDTTTGDTAVVGGSGNWDGATTNWTADAGATNEIWTAGDNATFGGTAGTVTVVGTQDVENITFQTDGYQLTGGALTYTNTAPGITVTTGTATIGSDITTTTGLQKSGNGTLVLSGANSLDGTLDVARGGLIATNAGALAGVDTFKMQSSSDALNVDLGGATLSVGDFIVNSPGASSLNNGTVSFTGLGQVGYATINTVIAGTGELRKTLPYTTTLNAVNTLTGPVNVNDGQLVIGGTGSILNTSGITIAAAGTLNVDGAGGNAISNTGTIDNSGTFILTGSDETVGSIFGSGDINLNANTLTTGDATNVEISGVISGAGDLVKQGAGTLTLSGANTYSGGTAINAGVLTTNNVSALGTGTVTVNGGALTLASDLTIGALAGAGNVTNGGNLLTTGDNNASTTYSGVLAGSGGLTKRGSGEMVLIGANTYTGETIVNAGTLTAGSADAFGNGANFGVGAGTADLGGFTITKNSLIVQNGTLRNGTLNMTAGGQFQNATIDAVLSGVGDAISAGPGTTILSAANTFTGDIIANRGTFDITGSTLTNTVNITDVDNKGAGVIVHGNSLADTAAVTISNSGVLTVAADETIGSLASTSATSSVVLNADLMTGGAGDDIFAGVVSGAGDLIKQGAGTFTLSGVSTGTGALINNAGTTVVSGTWGGDVENNATFDLTGTSTVNGTFYNNAVGSVTNSGGGTVALTGLSDFIGQSAINAGAGSITVSTENLTYRDGHSETGTVAFDVSDTITEERTAGPTWQGTGYTANFATAVDGVFTTGGDFTTTGGFTHDSTEDLTVSAGDTMTVASMANTEGSVINVQTNASLVGTANTTDNSGTVNVAGGGSLVEVTGDYNNLSAGIVNFNDAAAKVFDVQAGVITNDGTLNFNAGTTTVNSGGAIQNTGTGDINIANNATLNAAGDTIANAGTIDLLGTESALTFGTLNNNTGGVVNALGAVNGDVVNTGTGDFNGSGTLTGIGAFTNEAAATFDIAADATTVDSLTNTTTSGTGTTVATLGTLFVNGTIENGVAGGTAASLITNNGNLLGSGLLINHAGATLNSNTLTSALVATDVTNNGTMNIQGRMDADSITNSGSGATFAIVGNTYGSGAPSSTSPSPTPVGSFLNEAGATLNVASGEIELSTLTNTSAGTGTTLATAGVQVQAAGIIDAASVANNGTGTINNAGTIRATTITNGDSTNAATLTNTGTLTSFATLGSGIMNAAGSTLVSTGTIDADASADAAAFLNAGIADVAGILSGNVTNTGDFEATGNLAHTGAFVNSGTGTVTVTAGVMDTSGTFTNNSTVMGTTFGTAGVNIAAGTELEAQNVVNAAGASIVVAGTLDTTSGANNAINNLGTLTFDATGIALGGVSNVGTLVSTGQLNEGLINTGTATVSNQVLGNLANNAGQLNVAGDLTMNGVLSNAAGALVDVDAGSVTGMTILDNRGTGTGTGAETAGFEIDAGASVDAVNVLNTDSGTMYVAGTLIGSNEITNTGAAQLTSVGTLGGDVLNNATLNLEGIFNGALDNDGGTTMITGTLTGTSGANTGTVTNQNSAEFVMAPGSLITLDLLDNDATSLVTLNGATIDGDFTNAGDMVGAGIVTGLLDNSGAVDMADGLTGDELQVEGGLTSAGTYALDLDLVSGTPGVDMLTVQGVTTGDLALAFAPVAGTVLLMDSPLIVVDVDDAAANDFTYSTEGLPNALGPVAIYSSQAAANGDIFVETGASLLLGSMLEGVAQLEGLTMQGAGRLTPHSAGTCDGNGAWGRATGGETTANATSENSGQTGDIEVTSKHNGLELGANLGCVSVSNGWDISYAVLGGMNSGTSTQETSGDITSSVVMDFEQLYGGLSATASRGALTADVQLRYSQSEYKSDAAAGTDAATLGMSDDSIGAQAIGFAGAVSYRIPMGPSGFAVVPSAGMTVVNSKVDDISFDTGETLSTEDYTTSSSYVGATVQYEQAAPDGQNKLSAFVSANYHSSLSEAQSITLTDMNGTQSGLTTSGVDGFAEIGIGMDYVSQIDASRTFSVGLRADVRMGDNLEGYVVGLEVGLRF